MKLFQQRKATMPFREPGLQMVDALDSETERYSKPVDSTPEFG